MTIGVLAVQGAFAEHIKRLKELDMFDTLKNMIKNEVPVLATCAGLILLAEKLENDSHTYFGTLPVTVKRNAYGRQLGSFFTEEDFKGIGKIPMTFIRAPYIESSSDDVDIHTANLVDLVVFDLGDYQLFLDTGRVVASAVK